MRQSLIVIAALFLTMAIVPAARSAPRDYASLRKAADSFAARSKPGSKLWRVDLSGSYSGGSLQIQEGEFHYFLSTKDATDLLRVHVSSLEGMHLPQVEQRPWFQPEVWQMVPVPANALSPDDALRRLKRQLRGDPQRRLIQLNLIQAGAALADGPGNRFQWGLLADAMGVRRPDMDFFAKTAPLGKWIWWTVETQDRPYPGSDPRGPGTPQRVREFIYIDALTGSATSHCKGPTKGNNIDDNS